MCAFQDGDLVLNDLGGEYYCYASDITCTFPVNGKFNDMQRKVYEAVLDAKDAINSLVKVQRDTVKWSIIGHEVTGCMHALCLEYV
jgi:Xaa-Pro dipeptidase